MKRGPSLPAIHARMKAILGRMPTDREISLGHHFGADRAAQMLRMDPSTPTWAVFTPQEMKADPTLAQAGTIGKLNSSVMGAVDPRMAEFGGAGNASPAPAKPADLSSLGTLAAGSPQPASAKADLSQLGTLAV